MTSHCTACGHKPDPNMPGDRPLEMVSYYLVEKLPSGESGHVRHEETMCAMCITFLSISIHKHIETTKRRVVLTGQQKKTLAGG